LHARNVPSAPHASRTCSVTREEARHDSQGQLLDVKHVSRLEHLQQAILRLLDQVSGLVYGASDWSSLPDAQVVAESPQHRVGLMYFNDVIGIVGDGAGDATVSLSRL